MDRHLLDRCPNLKSIRVADAYDKLSMGYRCQDIVPSLSIQRPNLGTLDLIGRSALRFHPAIFDSTVRLSSLTLTVSRFDEDICFIPPVEELDRSYGLQGESPTEPVATNQDEGQAAPTIIRPSWTWDWDLLQLTRLSLTSEFAYRFEFKMLQGCPSLKSLHLDLTLKGRPDISLGGVLKAIKLSTELNS
ncbi:hypothetical protein BGX33_010744, partial [Mortierella sp. NVP41]